MNVYVLINYWDTPDNEGVEVVGVYRNLDNAISTMREEAEKVKGYYPVDYWEDDSTWEDDCEIHLGRCSTREEMATTHCWEIKKVEVQ